MTPCSTASLALRWALTHVTPLVCHADQRGMGPFFEFWPLTARRSLFKVWLRLSIVDES